MTTYFSGQQVVCVKKDAWSGEGREGFEKVVFPQYRRVYTIRSVHTHTKPDNTSTVHLIFEETKNNRVDSREVRFLASFFKPISNVTGMETLQKYLRTPVMPRAVGDQIEASNYRKRKANASVPKGQSKAP